MVRANLQAHELVCQRLAHFAGQEIVARSYTAMNPTSEVLQASLPAADPTTPSRATGSTSDLRPLTSDFSSPERAIHTSPGHRPISAKEERHALTAIFLSPIFLSWQSSHPSISIIPAGYSAGGKPTLRCHARSSRGPKSTPKPVGIGQRDRRRDW